VVSGSVHGDHRIITSANAYFNPGAVTWFFNDVLNAAEPIPALSTPGIAAAVLVLFSSDLLALGRRCLPCAPQANVMESELPAGPELPSEEPVQDPSAPLARSFRS